MHEIEGNILQQTQFEVPGCLVVVNPLSLYTQEMDDKLYLTPTCCISAFSVFNKYWNEN